MPEKEPGCAAATGVVVGQALQHRQDEWRIHLEAGQEPDIFANLYKNLYGAKVKLVAGYPGTNEIALVASHDIIFGIVQAVHSGPNCSPVRQVSR